MMFKDQHAAKHALHRVSCLAATVLASMILSAGPGWAQEVLPFPQKPSGSTAGRTGNVKIEVATKYAEKRAAGPLELSVKVNGREVAKGIVSVSTPLGFTANLSRHRRRSWFACFARLLRSGAIQVQRRDPRGEHQIYGMTERTNRRPNRADTSAGWEV